MIAFGLLLLFIMIVKMSPALGLIFIAVLFAFGKDLARPTYSSTLSGAIEFGVCVLLAMWLIT